MSKSIHLRRGDNINYNGQNAVVVSNPLFSRMIKIQLENGTIISRSRDDLFGMNQESSYLEGRIAECDKEIEKNWNIIEKAKKEHAAAMDAIHSCKKQMRQILSAFHANSYKQITDDAQRKEYQALSGQKFDAIMARNHATNEICDAAHSTGSVCFTKSGLLNQQSLFEHITQMSDERGCLG